jgi:ABC-type transport system substrate-binding protein
LISEPLRSPTLSQEERRDGFYSPARFLSSPAAAQRNPRTVVFLIESCPANLDPRVGFSPKGANRGHYSNARLDALLDDASANSDNDRRRADYVEAQQILARDLPAVNLWNTDKVVVHNRRLTNLQPAPSVATRFWKPRSWRTRASN